MTATTVEQELSDAFDRHSAGFLSEAELMYCDVLKRHPSHCVALHLLGVLHFQRNSCKRSEELIRRAIALEDRAEFQASLGQVLAARNQSGAAIEAFHRAIALRPHYVKAHFDLANLYYAIDETDRAIEAYRRAIALKPDHAQALNNLGNALQRTGRLDEAINAFESALRFDPDNALTHYNLGAALQALSLLDRAAPAYQRALALQPTLVEAHNNLGVILQRACEYQAAAEHFRQAIAIGPVVAAHFNNLGTALHSAGQFEPAEAAYREALRLEPDQVEALNNLGTTLHKLRRPVEAIGAYRKAIVLRPDSGSIFNNLANALKETGRIDEALACYQRAMELKPAEADYHHNLANALKDAGALDDALKCFRRAIELQPEHAVAHSGLLYCLHFHPNSTPRSLYEAHVEWDRRHAAPLAKFVRPHEPIRMGNHHLRIGYVSPDLRDHVVGRFMLPLLANHNRERFEIFCYADLRKPDAMSARLQSHADTWRQTLGMSHEALAELIRADQIDILVDLTMHMGGSRLLTFARKPAPIQVTYLAYCGTTGLSMMDYRLTDPYLDPPGADESCYSERSIRLPASFWCYQAPDDSPPVGPLPALKNGYLTFGCLNNYCKITEPTWAAWTRLLCELPDSRLVLHSHEGHHRNLAAARLTDAGVDPARLSFIGFLPLNRYLNQYNQIDIALDPFPYAGGTTTFDALWMGVPVVSLVGETAVSRSGLSILSNADLGELAVRSVEQYHNTAIRLARDMVRVSHLRAELRDRLSASPAMNARQFAREIENAYNDMVGCR
ncbi:MAG TPA: tetratricopeptide repeat protein [Humisphaera sp.]|jgi:predicted O-linked N-acetylglucosamine transferase (SPINDLY family)|nr:tetratricopeptide repeat protein [Humisphaera sp.]